MVYSSFPNLYNRISSCTDIMMQMKFTKDEIRTSLLNNRYDEVMATYLLLDEKRANLSVSSEMLLTSRRN